MNRRIPVRLMTALFTGLAAGSLVAQTTSGDPSATGVQPAATTAVDTQQTQTEAGQESTVYVPSLDGTGLIALNDTVRTHLLVGGTYSGGWDSNPDDLEHGTGSGAHVFSPYIGVQISSSNTQYIFQYQPTIREYSSGQYAGGIMNMASAKIVGNLNERWHWDFNAVGSYGQDSIRLLAPVQTEAVGNVPGTGATSASYLPNAGTVTYANEEAGIHYDKSERDIVELRVTNSYSRYSGLQQTSSIAAIVLSYQRAVSQTLSVSAYDQTSYYYGTINCASLGFGMGVSWKARQNTTLALTGGPQLDSAACGKQQGFAYTAAFNTRLSAKSQIYATSGRQMTTTYLGPGLWQESASGGYQRELTQSQSVGVDIGYVGSDALTATNSYHGTYFDGNYSHRIGHAFTASFSYRNYSGTWSQTSFSRRIALFSLAWTPGAGHLFQ
jgi:hypothetical protein